ncbi:MAG TPA: YCF48-related protein, partial [Candidatus Kapabacteria bacterium]|nr:YCF48-related protein [Candidatus Kapabacteria bacterium]
MISISVSLAYAQAGITPDTTKGDWYRQYPGLDFTHPQNFYAANNHTLYILFKGYLLRSTDAGATWAKKDLPGCLTVNGAQFLDDTNGWLVGNQGSIYKTTDGGTTWAFLKTGWSSVDFRFVSFISSSVGYVSGTYSVVLKTTDGGDTWVPQDYWELETTSSIAYVKAVNDSVVWVVDIKYYNYIPPPIRMTIFHSTDAGMTWQQSDKQWFDDTALTNTITTYQDFSDVICCSGTNMSFYYGYQVATLDKYWWRFATRDGGLTWDSTSFAIDSIGRFPNMFSCTTGWGIDDPFIYGRANYDGATARLYRAVNPDSLVWKQRTTPVSGNILQPFFYDFIDTDTGWCICQQSDTVLTVFQTTDGAGTWHVMSSQHFRTSALYDVCFINPDTGWAVGFNKDSTGIVLHTTNAGGDWNAIQYNKAVAPLTFLSQVQFTNALIGWALGDSIYKTTDGGITWKVDNVFPMDTLPQLADSALRIKYIRLQFVDSLVGWVVRNDWLTYRTTNGGITWGLTHLADTAVRIKIGKAVGENTFVGMGLLDSIPYEFRIIDPAGHWQEFQIISDTSDTNLHPGVPVALTFLDTIRGWFLDENSNIYYTQDRGRSWKFLSGFGQWSPPTNALFVDTSDGWLLTKSKRGSDPFTGASVDAQQPGIVELVNDAQGGIPQGCTGEQMNGITFLGDSLGWAVGENLAIYHYYVPASARPHLAPLMVLSTPGIDFGTVFPGTSVVDTFIVYNQGTAPLYLWSAWIPNDTLNAFLTVNILTGDSSVRVMPGDSLAFAVRFHPPIAVPFYATLYLASNADTQTVRLTGEGGFPQGVNEPVLESAELQNYPNPFTG